MGITRTFLSAPDMAELQEKTQEAQRMSQGGPTPRAAYRLDRQRRTSIFPFAGQSSGGLFSGSDSKLASCDTLQ